MISNGISDGGDPDSIESVGRGDRGTASDIDHPIEPGSVGSEIPGSSRNGIVKIAIAVVLATAVAAGTGYALGSARSENESASPLGTDEGSDGLEGSQGRTIGQVDDQSEDSLTLALDLHESGDLDAAAALYEKILEDDPGNIYPLYNLGLIAQTQGENEQAIERYDSALAINGEYVPALYNLALIRSSDGDLESAAQLLGKAAEFDPEFAKARFHLGVVLIALGDTEDGAGYLSEAVELVPSLRRG